MVKICNHESYKIDSSLLDSELTLGKGQHPYSPLSSTQHVLLSGQVDDLSGQITDLRG